LRGKPIPKALPRSSGWCPRGSEKTSAFIVRVRVSSLASSDTDRIQYSVEDVTTHKTMRFTKYEPAAAWLADRITTILAKRTSLTA
jgi:hypothetical protein